MPTLHLRCAAAEDAEAIAAIYAPYVLRSTASFETAAPTAAEMAARMEQTAGVFPYLVCEQNGRVIGYAYAGRLGQRAGYDFSAAASVYIDEAHCHSGAGRALYGALCRLLTAQGYRKLYGIVSCPNPGSEAFHEAMGFVREGLLQHVGYKFGRPLSVAYYGKELLPVTQNPPPPRRFDTLPPAEVAAALTP